MLPQRKGERQRNKPPVSQHSKSPTPKQNGWWATELISGTVITSHTSLSEELTRQMPLKEEKLVRLPSHFVRLRQSFCLNTNIRTGC
jgi:hypothetical protein